MRNAVATEIVGEVIPPPWETAPYGVVSLFDMLEFSAKDYVEMSFLFGRMMSSLRTRPIDGKDVTATVTKLSEEASRLGLPVTTNAIGQFLLEIIKQNPESARITGEDDERVIQIANAMVESGRLEFHFECIFSTLKAELSSLQFRVIPAAKSKYCDPKWLFESAINKQFPQAWKEFQAAGKCYAYGENTACAFHLQRALEWGLKSLAVHLGKPFERNSWDAHLRDIDKELTARYGNAGPRSKEEKFYSETAAQFGNMKVAWRNPTMHIEAKYDENESAYLLATIEQFMMQLSASGLKEGA